MSSRYFLFFYPFKSRIKLCTESYFSSKITLKSYNRVFTCQCKSKTECAKLGRGDCQLMRRASNDSDWQKLRCQAAVSTSKQLPPQLRQLPSLAIATILAVTCALFYELGHECIIVNNGIPGMFRALTNFDSAFKAANM